MLIGHAGLAAALRSVVDRPNRTPAFIALVAAAYAPDLLDLSFYFVGVCSPYGLYSHTLPSVVVQAAIIGGVAWLASRSTSTTILFILAVLLHAPADYLTGHKLVWPGADAMGQGWYDRPILDALLEFPVIVLGWWLLRRRAEGPPWARSFIILIVGLAPQLLFDGYRYTFQATLKPSTCFDQTLTFKFRSSN